MKSAFQEGREKIVRYSQIEHKPDARPPEAETVTVKVGENGKVSHELPPVPKIDFGPEPLKGLQPEKNIKVSLDGLNASNLPKKGIKNSLPPSQINKPIQSNPGNSSIPQNINQTQFGYQTRVTNVSNSSYKTGKFDYSEIGMKAAIALVLIVGGFFGVRGFMNNSKSSITKGADVNSGQVEMSATASVKVSVNSSPGGAMILLDGKDTGYRTPAIINVIANQESTIAIRRDGYLPYEVSRSFSETGQIAVTLQPAAQAAYVNIYISNGGPNTKIYVDNNLLTERIPVMRYPIMALKETVIRAVNPITQLSDEVRVRIRAGEIRNVELILGRSASNQRR